MANVNTYLIQIMSDTRLQLIVYFKTFALIQSTVMLPEKYVTLPRCVKVFFGRKKTPPNLPKGPPADNFKSSHKFSP